MLTHSDFHYDMPADRIAQSAVEPRDHARLLLINRATGKVSHHHVYDLPKLLPANYDIIANNTKVFPARLLGHKVTGGKVEILLTTPLGHSSYHCLTRPGLTVHDTVLFANSLTGIITHASTDIERTIKFDQDESILRVTLSQIGSMPTPPYIKQMLKDPSRYQTIYAKYGFSAAAPTAGLHFTPNLLTELKQSHTWHEITLNVGLGTFLPVKVEDITKHPMHSESYSISKTTADNLVKLKQNKRKLLTIGTTTLRALEANAALSLSSDPCATIGERSELLHPGSYSTSIYIYPPYQFKMTDALMTNFHLPESTLLMLVSAFCSYPNTQEKFTTFENLLLGRAYVEAIRENYRFFSFGDAMLIL